MDSFPESQQLLDAAEALFYERGFQAVGMAELRTASELPLKRIYSLYPGKDAIAVAMLDRRDERWMGSLVEHVDQETDARRRLLSVFTWLEQWLSGPGHRGCAWINAHGELSGTSPAVAEAVRRHKRRLREYLHDLTAATGASDEITDGIFLLVEGAMVTAGIDGDPAAATRAAAVARRLVPTG